MQTDRENTKLRTLLSAVPLDRRMGAVQYPLNHLYATIYIFREYGCITGLKKSDLVTCVDNIKTSKQINLKMGAIYLIILIN